MIDDAVTIITFGLNTHHEKGEAHHWCRDPTLSQKPFAGLEGHEGHGASSLALMLRVFI